MKIVLTALALICTLASHSQDYLDKKILVAVGDTNNLYQRVRIALGKHQFQAVEDGNYSVVTTYPRDLKSIPGYALAKVEIQKDTVVVSGIYGFLRQNYLGYTRSPNSYKDIMYMKGSKLWPLLLSVAHELSNDVSYSK